MYRREMFLGIGGLLMTPAIVKFDSLMQLSPPLIPNDEIVKVIYRYDKEECKVKFRESAEVTFANGLKRTYTTKSVVDVIWYEHVWRNGQIRLSQFSCTKDNAICMSNTYQDSLTDLWV